MHEIHRWTNHCSGIDLPVRVYIHRIFTSETFHFPLNKCFYFYISLVFVCNLHSCNIEYIVSILLSSKHCNWNKWNYFTSQTGWTKHYFCIFFLDFLHMLFNGSLYFLRNECEKIFFCHFGFHLHVQVKNWKTHRSPVFFKINRWKPSQCISRFKFYLLSSFGCFFLLLLFTWLHSKHFHNFYRKTILQTHYLRIKCSNAHT